MNNKKGVPLILQPEPTHCFQACLAMVLKFFLPERDFSFAELDKMTGKRPGKWTWPLKGVLEMRALGFDAVFLEDFDYTAFARDGEKYLFARLGKEAAEVQISHSDIAAEIETAKLLSMDGIFNLREPSIKDLVELTGSGYVVQCGINAYMLDGEPGYTSHSVIVVSATEKIVTINDPADSHREYYEVDTEIFDKAWCGNTGNDRNLIAFKLSR